MDLISFFETYILPFIQEALWFLGGMFVNFIKNRLPMRRLWGLQYSFLCPKETDVIIIVSKSVETDTNEYKRLGTGLGQVRAIGPIVSSLNQAYRAIDTDDIYISSDESFTEFRKKNVILLGGEKNNVQTRMFLDRIKDIQPISQEGSDIFWNGERPGYYGNTDDVKNKVLDDYGIIIRIQNPYSCNGKEKVYLFAGSHTYGTAAAAKIFTSRMMRKKLRQEKAVKKDFSAIIHCTVDNNFSNDFSFVKFEVINEN